jgi:hypothetical protein
MTWQTVVKRILEQESSLDRIGTLSSLTEEVRLKGVRRMLRGGDRESVFALAIRSCNLLRNGELYMWIENPGVLNRFLLSPLSGCGRVPHEWVLASAVGVSTGRGCRVDWFQAGPLFSCIGHCVSV